MIWLYFIIFVIYLHNYPCIPQRSPISEFVTNSNLLYFMILREFFCGVVGNVPVCDIIVSKFQLYYVPFQINTLRKSINCLISPAMGSIVLLLFSYRDDFGRGPRGLSRNLCMAQTLVSSSSHNPAYVPRPTFGFVKLLALSGSHCTKWADEQHRPAGFKSQLVPDLPLPFIPTLIGLRAFDHVSSRVWWETATNK